MATPYTSDGSVAYEDLAGEVDFLDHCGVNGMMWPQISSEYQYLTKEERLRGMQVLAQAARDRRPALMLGVQGKDTAEALEYTRAAEELEPDGMIAMPPESATSLADIRDYYHALGKVTRRPFVVQTSGGPEGIEPTVDFLVELAEQFPNMAYVKEEYGPVHQRMRQLLQHRPPMKGVFGGSGGQHVMHEMRFGSDGTIIGAPYADIYASIWKLYQEGQEAKARELFSKLLLMVVVEQQIPLTRPYIMKRRGVFHTAVSRRYPGKLKAAEIQEIEDNFEPLRPHLRAR